MVAHQAPPARASRPRTGTGRRGGRDARHEAHASAHARPLDRARRAGRTRGVWQVLSMLFTAEAQPGEPMVAGLGGARHPHLPLACRTTGRAGSACARSPTARRAAISRRRCPAGPFRRHAAAARASAWLVGALAGTLLGLAVSWSRGAGGSSTCRCSSCARCRCWRWCRCSSSGSAPISSARLLFVAYGVGVIVLRRHGQRGQQRAADLHRQCAHPRRPQLAALSARVVLPAILPELRSTMLLSLGAGWGAVLGAEYLGAQSGLGYIIVYRPAIRLSRPHVLRGAALHRLHLAQLLGGWPAFRPSDGLGAAHPAAMIERANGVGDAIRAYER